MEEIHEHDGKKEADAKQAEGVVHAVVFAFHGEAHAGRELDFVEDFADIRCNGAEVAVFGVHEHVGHALEAGVVDFDLAVCPARSDERAEVHAVVGWGRDGDGHAEDILEGAVDVFGELDADEVLVARGGIDPEVAVHRHAGIHRDHDLLDDILGGEAELGGLHSVHIQHQIGGVVALQDAHIHRAGDRFDEIADFARLREQLRCGAAFDLDVDRRGGSQIQSG